MNLKSFAHLLSAFFIAVSLLFSPLPVSAAVNSANADQMAAMMDDMPDCPKPMTNDDCQKCSMTVVCLVKSVATFSDTTFGKQASYAQRLRFIRVDDALGTGLGFSAPARPPRTSVIPA